jgi:hypothetical protein
MGRRTSKLTQPVWPDPIPTQAALPQTDQWLELEPLGLRETLPTQPGHWPATAPVGTGTLCTNCGASLDSGSMFCQQCGSLQSAGRSVGTVALMPKGQRVPVIPVPVVVLAPKSVGLAAFLEILLPGAGLAYLGRIFPAVLVFFLSVALGAGIVALTNSTECLGLFAVMWLIVRLGGIINDTEQYNRQALTQLR